MSFLGRTAAIGVVVLVAACGSPLPSTIPDAGWTALRWATPAFTAPYEHISDVVAWDGGYVAVGSFQNVQGRSQAAAWISPDWRTWTRTLRDVPAAGDSMLNRIVMVGGRLVAIGTSGERVCNPPAGEGAVCDPLPVTIRISADGRSWEPPASPAAMTGLAVDAVASDGHLLLLAGNTGWDRPAIWATVDGTTWQQATLPAASFANAHFAGLTVSGSGFILTGSTGGKEPACCVSGNSDTTPAAWLSADGTAWDREAVDGASAALGDAIGPVFAGRSGMVAWGGRDASHGWASPDGRRWSALPKPAGYPVIPRASDGNGIVGDSYSAGDTGQFWWSGDGTAWRALTNEGQVDQMPSTATGAWADAEFLFPGGVGLIGQNGTDREPLWFARASAGS